MAPGDVELDPPDLGRYDLLLGATL
jgi:hypothetical protein